MVNALLDRGKDVSRQLTALDKRRGHSSMQGTRGQITALDSKQEVNYSGQGKMSQGHSSRQEKRSQL